MNATSSHPGGTGKFGMKPPAPRGSFAMRNIQSPLVSARPRVDLLFARGERDGEVPVSPGLSVVEPLAGSATASKGSCRRPRKAGVQVATAKNGTTHDLPRAGSRRRVSEDKGTWSSQGKIDAGSQILGNVLTHPRRTDILVPLRCCLGRCGRTSPGPGAWKSPGRSPHNQTRECTS